MKRKAASTPRSNPSPLYTSATTQPDTSHSILSNPNPNTSSFTELPWPLYAVTATAEADDSLSRSMSMNLTAERIVSHQPHWENQETKELIFIRGEVEREYAAGSKKKRSNRTMWEAVSKRMLERGFVRSPDQCKGKWKTLVHRYKGKETSDPETSRQCPFFEELHAVFTERERDMQRLLLESEADASKARKRAKRVSGGDSSDDLSDDEDENIEESEDEKPTRRNLRKKKSDKAPVGKSKVDNATNSTGIPIEDVQEILKEFLQQQQKIEMQWAEMMHRRAVERQLFEEEWRQSMEKLERERLMTEQAWREKEEERRRREESRAERRDALLTALLNKLLHDNNT